MIFHKGVQQHQTSTAADLSMARLQEQVSCPFMAGDLIPAHSSLARDVGSAHTPGLLVKEETSNSHLQSLVLVSSFQLCLLPVAQIALQSPLHSHHTAGYKIPRFSVVL